MELVLAGAVIALLAAVAWPAVRGAACRLRLTSDAAQLERALRHARDTAIFESRSVSLDGAAVSGSLLLSTPTVRFYPDGTADAFSASMTRGGTFVGVSIDVTGRIRVDHAAP